MSKKSFIKIWYISFLFLLLFCFGFSNILASNHIEIKITEIMYDPIGSDTNREWIEIYNNSDEHINISNLRLYKNETNNHHNINIINNDVLPPNEFLIITGSGSIFLEEYPEYDGILARASFNLRNTSDTISIKHNDIIKDTLQYESNMGGNGNGYTLEKDLNDNIFQSFILYGTPGYLSTENSEYDFCSIDDIQKNSLIINELVSDPFTGEPEWIEIYNTEDCDINLAWIQIEDNVQTKNLSGIIKSNEYQLLYDTVILNNAGDIVILKKGNTIIDSVEYGNYASENHGDNNVSSNAPRPGKGQSIGRYPNLQNTDNDFFDFKIFGNPTPNAPNIVNNNPPIAKITVQHPYRTEGIVPFSINLTGTDSFDPDNDALEFFWDYGDGHTYEGINPPFYKYENVGNYQIKLTVTDSWGASDTARLNVKVLPKDTNIDNEESSNICDDVHESNYIKITEVFPHPETDEHLNEFIELKNIGNEMLNLCGWSIDDIPDGGSKRFLIDENILLEPNQYIAIYRTYSKIILNNTGDEVNIYSPSGKLVDSMRYGRAIKGQSFQKIFKHNLDSIQLASISGFENKNYIWAWQEPSPNEKNRLVLEDTTLEYINEFDFQSNLFFINEIYPNTENKDAEEEFIELISLDSEIIDLTNYYIDDILDGGSKRKNLKDLGFDTINPNEILVIERPISKIVLNNDIDCVNLLYKDTVIDFICYDKTYKGKSYSRIIENMIDPIFSSFWVWTNPSKGQPNNLDTLKITSNLESGEYIFPIKLELQSNIQGAKIFYAFDDNIPFTEFIEYEKSIEITSETNVYYFGMFENMDTKIEKLSFQNKNITKNEIYISEIFTNAKGSDKDKEWIEVFNNSNRNINLENYSIQITPTRNLQLPNYNIKPNEYYALFSPYAINNKHINVKLLYNGIEIQNFSFYDSPEDKSIIAIPENDNMIYELSNYPTFGRENFQGELNNLSFANCISSLNTAHCIQNHFSFLYFNIKDDILYLYGISFPEQNINVTVDNIRYNTRTNRNGIFSVPIYKSIKKGDIIKIGGNIVYYNFTNYNIPANFDYDFVGVSPKIFSKDDLSIIYVEYNPEGLDTLENEYIEIQNKTNQNINLKNTVLDYDNGYKKFVFQDDYIIPKNSVKKIYGTTYRFILKNSEGHICLKNYTGSIIDCYYYNTDLDKITQNNNTQILDEQTRLLTLNYKRPTEDKEIILVYEKNLLRPTKAHAYNQDNIIYNKNNIINIIFSIIIFIFISFCIAFLYINKK